MATAIATAAPTGVLPLVGEFGTDAYARIDRDIILNSIRQSTCLSEKTYWFLILTSRCGPTVTRGCYLRDRRGYAIKDKAGREVPVRQKDICEALQAETRGGIYKALQRLVRQKRLVIEDGVLYPVLEPAKLAELLALTPEMFPPGNISRKMSYIGVPIPEELYQGSPESVQETIAGLERIAEGYEKDRQSCRKHHQNVLLQYISEHCNISEEEIEEIGLSKHTQQKPSGSGEPSPVCVPDAVSSDPPEAPPTPAVPPNALIKPFDPAESWACFWSVYSGFSDSKQEEAKRWWFRHVRSDEYAVEVMEGLLRWKASDRWSRGIVQHAVNFLKNHEYRESPAPKRAASKREEVKDRLMEWADARDRAKEQRNGGGT